MDSIVNAASGGFAAVCSCILLYPLDTILVRYQSRFKEHSTESLIDVLLSLLNQPDVIKALYRGVHFKCYESFVRNCVYFYWCQLLQSIYIKKFGKASTAVTLVIATVAGMLNQCMTAPMEVVTTAMQTSSRTPLTDVIKEIYMQQGIPGFYKGFGASIILCSNPAITNSCFDKLKLVLQNMMVARPSNTTADLKYPDLSASQLFLIGAIAKAVATVITYPYIRTKVIMQRNWHDCTDIIPEPSLDDEFEDIDDLDISIDASLVSHPHISKSKSATEGSPISLDSQRNFRKRDSDRDNIQLRSSMASLPNLSRLVALLKDKKILFPEKRNSFNNDKDLIRVASFCCSEGIISNLPKLYEDSPYDNHFQSNSVLPLRKRVHAKIPTGVMGVLVSIFMQEGIPGFYKGISLQLLKTVLAAAIMYTIKEKIHARTRQVMVFLASLIGVIIKAGRRIKAA
eukprot:GHVL01003887.1.p1 GENE.GHVL01003887.1~~GHVL01003887.1.p1  ORF type:complete len:456 (+),score=65.43 GHVL01003887.1:63-1430(+)